MHLRTENFSLKTDIGNTLKLKFKNTEMHVSALRDAGFILHALYRSFKINRRYVPVHKVQCKDGGPYIVNFTNPTRCLHWFVGTRGTPRALEYHISHNDYAKGQKIEMLYDASYLGIYLEIRKGETYKKISMSFLRAPSRVYVGQHIGKSARGSRFELKGHDLTIDISRIPDHEHITTQ